MKEQMLLLADISQERLEEVRSKYGATIYGGNDIYNEAMDIYAPCALGATLMMIPL